MSGSEILLSPKPLQECGTREQRGLEVGARLGANAFCAGLAPRLREHYFPYSCAHFGAGKQTSGAPRLLDRNPTRGGAARCEEVPEEARGKVRGDLRARMGRGRGWETAERHKGGGGFLAKRYASPN